MEKIKDILFGTLGVFGYILYYLVTYVLCFIPIIILDFPFLLNVLIFIAIQAIPIIGSIVYFLIWLLALPLVLSEPVDALSIIYYVGFGIYVLTTLVPLVISLIGSAIDYRRTRK